MFRQTSSAAVCGGKSIHRIAQVPSDKPSPFTMGRCFVKASGTDKTELSNRMRP